MATPVYGKTEVPVELTLKWWAKATWQAGIKESYFYRFMGHDSKSIVHVKEELEKGKGTSINIALRLPLVGAGKIEGQQLENNEEALQFADFDVYLHQIRHATRIKGKFEEQKTQINLRKESHEALADWWANWLDQSIFGIATGIQPDFVDTTNGDVFPFTLDTPTADRIIYGGSATAENTITPADTFDTKLIGKAKRMARADKIKAIRPIRIDGQERYVMVLDQYQMRDLRRDPVWIEAQQHANIRGEKNPIFSGASGIYDGVVIHECLNVPRTATGASGAMVGHALFLGAQAITFAEGSKMRWDEETFDYGNEYGVSVERMLGLKKSQFKYDGTNWTDYGLINVMTSSEPD